MPPLRHAVLAALLLSACNASGEAVETGNRAAPGAAQAQATSSGRPFQVQEMGRFNEPWAMTFLPNGPYALITEKAGQLKLWRVGSDSVIDVAGVPAVDAGGQGGLGDVVLHPNFAQNNLVYLSWVEPGDGGTRGAAVGRARLVFSWMIATRTDGGEDSRLQGVRLSGLEVIWRQHPKVDGRGHFGHRLAFGPDGKLYISNGERQKFDPAQDMGQALGKVVRINEDGSVPADNPWAARGGVTAQLWTLGHRNPLGIAFDAQGRLWEHEMGPRGGDEFNLIVRGRNYGYPIVSNGDHYDRTPIPDHDTRPEFAAPLISWTPVISPAGLIIYSGALFPQWRGDAFMGALSGQALVRVDLDGATARLGDRWDMGERIREVEQGPDGAIWLLEDGAGGRLLRLTPAR